MSDGGMNGRLCRFLPPFTLSAMLPQIDTILKILGAQRLFASFTLSVVGYIAAADAQFFGHLALPGGDPAEEAVAH